MSKTPSENQIKKKRSKQHGLIAHFARKLRLQNEQIQIAQAVAQKAPSSGGQQNKSLPEVDQWIIGKREVLSAKKSQAMARFKMATGGGPFQGR